MKRWKAESLHDFQRSAEQNKATPQQARSDKTGNQAVTPGVHHKNAVLVEAAVLLVLRKVLNAL